MKNNTIEEFIKKIALPGAPGAIALAGFNILSALALIEFTLEHSKSTYQFDYVYNNVQEQVYNLINQDTEIYNKLLFEEKKFSKLNLIPKQMLSLVKDIKKQLIGIYPLVEPKYFSDYYSSLYCLNCIVFKK